MTLLAPLAGAQTLHVDRTLGNNANPGTAVAPFRTVTFALAQAAATPGVTRINVAQGTYKPGTLRTDTFRLVNDVDVYGGYQSGTLFTVHDPDVYTTVLSGEIGAATNTDNCYTVVTAVQVSGVTLSGFRITRGYGGVAGTGGAGMYLRDAAVSVMACDFVDDVSDTTGGGAYVDSGGNVWFDACTFRSNAAQWGGGALEVYAPRSGLPDVLVSVCRFLGNTAGPTNAPLVVPYGGAIGVLNGNVDVFNSDFCGNVAEMQGGAVGIKGAQALVQVVNCSMTLNRALQGGATYCSSGGTLMVGNTILWGDAATVAGSEEYSIIAPGVMTVQYSCVAGGAPPGAGNFSADPHLIDPDGADDVAGTLDDDLHIPHPMWAPSPCADAGSNTLLGGAHLQRDIDGEDRTQRSFSWQPLEIVDVGADELPPVIVLFPGSRDDLHLHVVVNGGHGSVGGTDVVQVGPGDRLGIEMSSPRGARNGLPAAFGLQSFVGNRPPGGIAGFPQTHVNLGATFVPLGAVPTVFLRDWPVSSSLTGATLMVQAFAFGGGVPFVTSDGREVRFR